MRRTTERCRAAALAFALAFGCGLAEDLKGEPCEVPEDCWHTQHCARTAAEELAALPGICLPKDVPCETGAQLGCACIPGDFEKGCDTPAIPLSEIDYPTMICDEVQLICTLEPPEGTTEG